MAVRIDYEISPSGEPKVRSLADAVELLRQREAALAVQLGKSDEAANKSAAAVNTLQEKLKSLGGSQSVDLGVTKTLSDVHTSLLDVLNINRQISSERLTLNVDDAGIRRGLDDTKAYLALLRAVHAEQQKSLLTAASAPERINTSRTIQLEAINQLRGTRPESEVIGLENKTNQAADREILAQRLAPVSKGADTLEGSNEKAAEQLAFLEGKEQGVLAIRKESLENIRQQNIAQAKSVEEIDAIDAAVNRHVGAAEDFAQLREQIRQRREILASEEAVNRLVEKTNQSELSGVQKIRAERERILELYGKTPELRTKITESFDKQAARQEQEDKAGAHGNVRQLFYGAKDLSEGYTRGVYIRAFDYLLSLRGAGGGAGGVAGGAGAAGSGGAAGEAALGLSGGVAKLGLVAGGTALAIGLIGKKLYDLVEAEAAAARETVNLGLRLGITGAQTQQLADAASIVGVKIESIQSGAHLLATALEDPSGSGKKAAEGLNQLGISILATSGNARELGPVFLEVLTGLSKLSSGTERAALATKILGAEEAKTLEPLISDYGELQKVVNQLHPVDPTALAEADKQFKQLHLDWQELRRDFDTKLIPVVEPVIHGAEELLTGKNSEGQSPTDIGTEAEFVRQQRHPGVLSNLLNAVSPYATTIPTPEEHKAYLAQFGPEGQAKAQLERRNKVLSALGRPVPQSAYDDSSREATRFLSGYQVDADTRRAELGNELKQAQERQRVALGAVQLVSQGAGKTNKVPVDIEVSQQRDLTTASRDVAKIQAQIKALEAGPRTENRFQAELDRIAAESYKEQHPASEFGHIPELQTQLQDTIAGYRRDEQFRAHPQQLQDLIRARQQQENTGVILEARHVAGNQEFQRFGERRIDTEAGIQGLQSQFALAQRIAALRSQGKDETEGDVEQAYERQLALARQIRDIHLNDLQIEKEKLSAIGDHSHDADIAKDEANIHKQFVAEQVRAEAERAERNATIRKQQQDEDLRTQQELAKLQTETEARSFADKINHVQKLADINRQPGESPIVGVQSAYETRLKLAQLEHDTVVAENAITYSDKADEGKRKIADEEALKTLTEERQTAEYEAEEKLAELRKQERDEAKQQAASLYDALRGGEKSTREFFKAQLNDIGRNLFSAGFAPILQGASNLINPSGGGFAGTALQNTLLGSSTGASQAQSGTPTQQPTGFFGRVEHILGFGPSQPQHPAIGTPAVASHAEPLITSLDSNRDAIHDLTAAILGVTPGGGVGPNPLAQHPIPASATAQEPLPGVTELGASSLVQSSQNAVDAVQTLAQSQPAQAPISVSGQAETEDVKPPIQTPHFSPNIHVQPSALNLIAPATGPSYSSTISNAYHDGGKTQAPISVPQREQVSSTSYGPPAETPAPASGNLSPHGFAILGGKDLATTALAPGILSGSGSFHPDTHGIHVTAPLSEATSAPSGDTGVLSFLKNTFTKTTEAFNVENLLHGIDSTAESLKAGDVKGAVQSLDPSLSKIGDDTIQKVQKGDYSGALANVLPLATSLAGEIPAPSEVLGALSRLPADHPIVQALRDETGSIGPGSGLSRSEIAKAAYKPADAVRQAAADRTEIELSKALGIPRTEDTAGVTNAPFDLQSKHLGIEVKTLFDNANDKITVNREALNRKLAEAENTGISPYTVVVDRRGTTPDYYYKPGVGSFRLGSLTQAKNLADLKRAIKAASAEHVAPPAPDAFQIYSPQEGEGLSFEQAIAAIDRPAHRRVFDASKQIDEALHIKGLQENAIGDTTSYGTENSIFNTIASAPSYEAVRYSAALKGDLANQKAVIPFEVQKKGPDSLYRTTVPNVTPEQLRVALDAAGLQYRTLIPKEKVGTEVSVFDPGSELRDNIKRFAQQQNVQYRSYRGQGEFLGGDTREAGHEAYHRIIADYESRSGDRLHERFVGHELPNAGTRQPALPQEVISPEFSATQRFIDQPIPTPESPISSLSKSPYGFDVLGDKDLAATALTPGILADSPAPVSAPASAPVLSLSQPSPVIASAFENYAASQRPSLPAVPAPLASLPAQFSAPTFASQHPTIARTGGTIAQLAALSAPAAIRSRDELGDLQYNKYAIGTAAYGDVGILLNALDRRKTASTSTGGKIFDQIEGLFGVARKPAPKTAPSSTLPGPNLGSPVTDAFDQIDFGSFGGTSSTGTVPSAPPTSSGQQQHPAFNSQGAEILSQAQRVAANPFSGSPAILHTGQSALSNLGNIYSDYQALKKAIHPPPPPPAPAPPVIAAPGPFPQTTQSASVSGQLPTYPGQTIPGTFSNSGTDLTRLDSGLILRQSPALTAQPSDISSRISYPPDYESLPTAPAFTPSTATPAFNPSEQSFFGIPTPPPFTTPSPGAGFTVDNSNANAAAIHAAVIDNGLSARQFGFNTDGGQILPQSSIINTILGIGTPLLSGIGSLGGLGGGGDDGDDSVPGSNSSPSGYATQETIDFGGGNTQTVGGTGLFGGDSSAGSNYDANGNFLFNSPGAGGVVGFGGGDDGSSGSSNTLGNLLGGLGSQGSGLAKAIGGFSAGGATGASSGVASSLSVAAAVDPEPISKAILGMSAAVAGIVSALLGDPRARRQKHLTQEIETDKRAAFAYTQPGINVEESAAGGHSVDTDFQGNSRVLNSKPYVYDINEAVGFDPIHPDRVVTQAVRQIGNAPLPGVPVAPLASTDLTTPVRAMTDTASYAGTTGSAAQIATQQQTTSALSNVTFNNTWNNSSMDHKDVMAHAPAITDAVVSQLLTSHRISGDIRALVNPS